MSEGRPILAVTGVAFEARIASDNGVVVVCAGGDPIRLRTLLDQYDPKNFSGAISFGLAGGLDPALRPGDLVVANRVVSGTQVWPAAPALTSALQTALRDSGARVLDIAGVDATVLHPAGKAALRKATGASAVDMESHVVAAFASEAKLPWVLLRAICDPAHRALPPLSSNALKPDGGIDLAATFTSLVREPAQIPALIRTGLDTAIAVAALRRARRLLGFGFGLVGADLG